MQPLLGPVEGDRLHVMSYNLRYPADEPGHQWEERRPAMAALLNLERPTVIGTQEGFVGQLRDVVADLPAGYEWIGEGGAPTAVVYDTARLEPTEYSHFWLSDTPHIPKSTTWGNRIPRMATWVRFTDTVTDTQFVVLNTHLDHRSALARGRSAELLCATIESFEDTPVIVTGDFNTAAETSAAYDLLVHGAGLADSWHTAQVRRTPEYATFCRYRAATRDGPRIDWILTTPDTVTEAIAINPTTIDGRYPSDHLPVQAHLRLPDRPWAATTSLP